MWVQKVVQSKFIKCFLIALVLVFSYEVSKPKAFVPLAWAGAVLAGMAAETLVTMGVKAVSKEVLKRKADDYAAQALKDGKFDFMGTNPYRNKDGSISLSPSANDRAKMAGLISGALIGSMIGDDITGDLSCPKTAVSGDIQAIMPNLATTHGWYQSTQNQLIRFNSFYDTVLVAKSDGTFNVEIRSFLGNVVKTFIISSGMYNSGTVKVEQAAFQTDGDPTLFAGSIYYIRTDGTKFGNISYSFNHVKNNFDLGQELANANGAKLLNCGDMFVPSTISNVYPAPMDMSSTYKMPNDAELANKPIVIYNVMPAGTEEGPITWNEIEDYYNTSGKDFQQVMDSNIDNYVAKGTINENTYVIGEINNYYTDINYPEKVADFKPPTGEVEVPGDNLPGEPVSDLDPSMWQVMKNTYNYLDDGIDASLASMKGITDSAQGITTYLNQTMGWLPMEFRAVLTSAFVLGVFAHFLRR